MNKQKIFDHVVKTLNGKGPAMSNRGCCYVAKNHPGCAIGCLPGIREQFGERLALFDESIVFDSSIDTILNWTNYQGDELPKDFSKELRQCLEVENDDDVDFLVALQILHDEGEWVELNFNPNTIANFSEKWNLQNPLVKTITEKLWVRMGDAAEYESFDDLEEAAANFHEAGIQADEMNQRSSGITTPEYAACDYISLFWGEDDQPEMIRDVTIEEFEHLKKLVKEG